jgi:hypothetical protein
MYERLKKRLEARAGGAEALEKGVKRQLLEAYKLGVQAARTGQDELADLCACYIYDMLDWGRRHLDHFSDEDVILEARLELRGNWHPAILRDFETMVEGDLATAVSESPPGAGVASSLPL